MSQEQLNGVYDLLRRVPPNKIETRLFDAISLVPDLEETLLSTVDTPLKIKTDEITNHQFVACEFNRDYDSHRSPFSNQYFPPIEDGQKISERLRAIEVKANNAFQAYCHLYFKGGTSSVYLWEIEENTFGFGVFIKNEVDTTLTDGRTLKGCIDCSDTIEVDESESTAKYTLTSSVIMRLEIDIGLDKPLIINGSVSEAKVRQVAWTNDDDHIVNVGKLVEDNSTNFRDIIEEMYVKKLNHIAELLKNTTISEQQKLLAQNLQKKFDIPK